LTCGYPITKDLELFSDSPFSDVRAYDDYIQMATPVEEEREIEVLERDEASNSFTTAGDTNPDLDRLRRDLVIIRLLVLTQGGNTIAEIPNVRIKASHSHLYMPRVQPSIEMPPIESTDYEYERLDH
jgi:hypothetical protein